MTGRSLNVLRRFCVAFFLPLSLLWGGISWLRRKNKTWLRPVGTDLPVISIGNIHAGGSGKTPLVIALSEHFQTLRPCVLSRGYRSRSERTGAWLDPQNPDRDFEYGDEPCLISERTGVPVWVGRDRVRGAKTAATKGSGLILLDDGFQYLNLDRDLDIVAIHTSRSIHETFCHPLGDLREPVSSLADADAVVLMSSDEQKTVDWTGFVERSVPGLPVFEARCFEVGLWEGQEPTDLDSDSPILGFCAIALPQRFELMLKARFDLRYFKNFRDHHCWQANELSDLAEQALRLGTQTLVCTEKDWIKVKNVPRNQNLRWLHSRIRYELSESLVAFLNDRDKLLGKRSTGKESR